MAHPPARPPAGASDSPAIPRRSYNLAGARRLLRRTPPGRLAGSAADALLDARQRALGIGREIDLAASERPARRLLVMGIYGSAGAGRMAAGVERLRQSRHSLVFALGSIGPPAPRLAEETAIGEMRGGKFTNLNRLAEGAEPLAADWIVLIDDDIDFGPRLLDRLVLCAERFRFQIAQPALSRASYAYWRLNLRHAAIARRTAFVEVGPLVLLHRDAFRELTPFPVEGMGMGWGLDLVWAAKARRLGWRLGIVDAAPVRHEARRTASGYDHAPAREAAMALLRAQEHISFAEVETEFERYTRL